MKLHHDKSLTNKFLSEDFLSIVKTHFSLLVLKIKERTDSYSFENPFFILLFKNKEASNTFKKTTINKCISQGLGCFILCYANIVSAAPGDQIIPQDSNVCTVTLIGQFIGARQYLLNDNLIIPRQFLSDYLIDVNVGGEFSGYFKTYSTDAPTTATRVPTRPFAEATLEVRPTSISGSTTNYVTIGLNTGQTCAYVYVISKVNDTDFYERSQVMHYQIPVQPPAILDIDVNRKVDALTDGLLVLRYLFGFRGESLINAAIDANADRTTATDIEAYLLNMNALDIDNNGEVDALTDGILILRYLFGFNGDSLINGVIGMGAGRSSASDIKTYLDTLSE